MSISQNGWPVNPTRDNEFNVAGVTFPGGVRTGDVATVLHYVAQRMHDEVEKAIPGECWGYANRPIRGQTTGYSNHASATAIDFNAPKHPRGSKGTFTAAQVRRIHAIVASTADKWGAVVRWGGDYTSGLVDEMHFEINAPSARVATVAKRIREDTVMAKLDKDDLAAIRGIIHDEVWGYHRKDSDKDASQLLQDIHNTVTDPHSVLSWGYKGANDKVDMREMLATTYDNTDEIRDRMEEQ